MSGAGPNFTATIDFAQVNREIAQVEKRNEGAVLAYGKLEGAMNRTEVASRKLGAYLQTQYFPTFAKLDDGVTKTTRGFWNMEGAAKAVQSRLAPQAAAISGISAALGENAGQTGKAVAAAGQLAAAWAAGGPLGLAGAALGVIVIELTKHWEDLIKKQDEALERSFSGANKVIDERKRLEDRLNKLRATEAGPETGAQAYLRVQKEIDDAERRLTEARANRDRAGFKNLAKTIELLKDIQTLEATAAVKRNQKKGAGSIASGAANDDEEQFAIPERDLFSMAMIEEEPRERARRLAIEKRLNDEQVAEDRVRDLKITAETKLAADLAQIQADSQEIALRKRLANEQMFADAMMDLTRAALLDPMQAAVGQATSVFSNYLEMKIAGEKHAEEQATAAFLKGIGSQLVGIGTRSVFEGGAKLFNPVTAPVGLAEMAFGGAAIAAGLGLGAAGAGVSAQTPQEPKSNSGGARDRGIGSGLHRGAGGNGDGGGLHLHITYSAAGPAPEQTGREVERSLDALRARRGEARVRRGPVSR